MAEVVLEWGATVLGSQLSELMQYDDPGGEISYELCKLIYTFHALGAKIASNPVKLAMSQSRIISIPDSPEDMVKEAFERAWKELKIDDTIFYTKVLSRIYGVSACAIGAIDHPTDQPLPMAKLSELKLYFNTFDPLNTAGSMVLNQDPNAPDFMKCTVLSAAGQQYHFSRTCIIQNEIPIYLSYTPSTFGFNGRSCYQRALFSLKSYVTAQIASAKLLEKAAVIVAKRKAPGSFTDKAVGKITNLLREWIKSATNGNVISITPDDSIETLNLTNADHVLEQARNNIIEDIASSVPMPAKMLLEGYAGVLANGTEDFKATMQFINGLRMEMLPLFDFFDNIVQRCAWSPEFYERVQKCFPSEYGRVSYEAAFYSWKNSFTAIWPSMLEEPDSEKAKLEKVRLESLIQLMEKMVPDLDPDNKAKVYEWVQDNVNSLKTMFSDPMEIDFDALILHLQEKVAQEKLAAQNPIGYSGIE